MNIQKFIPIRTKEWPKFLLTSFIMVLTLYIYSILRGTKDTLVISEMGAESISALKLYGVLPGAILIMLLYTKLVDHMSRTKLYHTFNWLFVGFFILFDLVLYPNAKDIHFDFGQTASQYPIIKYQLIIIGNWSYSLFYIMSELWGSMMLSLMFWQLANQINTIDEAKRFYPLFGFLGQFGLISSGVMTTVFTNNAFVNSWTETLHYISMSILVCGVFISIIIYSLGEYVIGHEAINGTVVKSKKKSGIIQSLKYVFSSKYIGLITILILCYGISINLVEGVWKKQLGLMYPDKTDLSVFNAKVQICTGVICFIAMLMGSYMLRIYSWQRVALVTPIVILVTGIPFFGLVIFKGSFESMFPMISILLLAVLIGAAQNILSKAIKYSFFDPTKEMAYIPLDPELKAKGKAAADVIGGRLGKSGGAIIQWSMLALISGSTLTSIAPTIAVIFVVIIIAWFYGVVALNKEFIKKTEVKEETN